MYRKPRFLEMLHAIREEMSREADYDVDLFAEMVRSGARPGISVHRLANLEPALWPAGHVRHSG